MSTELALFLRTFVIGLAVAAPVGAMGVLCIQRTLTHGPRVGLATGAGIATADGTYAALAAFGVSALSNVLVAWQVPLRLVGGAVLVYLGIRCILQRPAACDADVPAETSTRLSAVYGSAIGLTLTNPMTIMAFGAIFASAGLAAQPGPVHAAIATAGVALGSLTWWVALVTGVTLARAAVGDRFAAVVSRVSGGVIAAFGVLAIVSAVVR